MANDIVPTEAGLPAVWDFGEDAGKGFEHQTAEEFQLPFIALLQDLSPQVTGEGGASIAGAKAGKFFNTVTEEVFDSFDFVPAHKERVFVEWRPRQQGGGFVARYLPDDPIVLKARAESKEFGQYLTPNRNNLVDTVYLFGIVDKGDGVLQQACLSFSITKMKVYKKWNTQVNAFTLPGPNGSKVQPPRWAHLLAVSSKRDKSPKGSFFNIVLAAAKGGIRESVLAPTDQRYQEAKSLAELVSKGVAKVSEEKSVDADDETNSPF